MNSKLTNQLILEREEFKKELDWYRAYGAFVNTYHNNADTEAIEYANKEQDIVYPFKEGDDYYTIEDNKIVWSCWDNISEEFYRDDPNRLLFQTKEQAQEYINKLNK